MPFWVERDKILNMHAGRMNVLTKQHLVGLLEKDKEGKGVPLIAPGGGLLFLDAYPSDETPSMSEAEGGGGRWGERRGDRGRERGGGGGGRERREEEEEGK